MIISIQKELASVLNGELRNSKKEKTKQNKGAIMTEVIGERSKWRAKKQ